MSESEALAVIDPVVSSVHLVARNPVEMQNAQADLAVWLKHKITETDLETRELQEALEGARKNKWKTAPLARQVNKSIGRHTYYSKILAAVEAGYTIIPEFPIEVFAIRVTRSGVRGETNSSTGTWGWPDVRDELPDIGKIGEGEYKNPEPLVKHKEFKDIKNGEEVVTRYTTPTRFQDEVVFPLRAARPAVMSATSQAMALKVFDQIGICEPRRVTQGVVRAGDPLIIGQILGRRENWSQKCTSFIIAWHLNLNDL